ncbi:MAG: YicC family protein [Candidatus Dadabacteria bacterium]|nr:MAG: YicC family protein [Candidatus Dadabacteria bacterium]
MSMSPTKAKGKSPVTLSMTGYGHAVKENGQVRIEVEIKTVNNRFIDISFKMPRSYLCIEHRLKDAVKSVLSRGKVDVYISRTPLDAKAVEVAFNRPLFEKYYGIYLELCKITEADKVPLTKVVSEILHVRDVLSYDDSKDLDESESELVVEVLREALNRVIEMRRREGEVLCEEVLRRLSGLSSLKQKIEAEALGNSAQKMRLLEERLKELSPDIVSDRERLAMEAAYLADKVDVTEELKRLESHLAQFNETLSRSPQGRKLDFIVQELYREFNTIASKAQSGEIQGLVIDAKVELEKIREQIQNIE